MEMKIQTRISQKTTKLLKKITNRSSLPSGKFYDRENLLNILRAHMINLNFQSASNVLKFLQNTEKFEILQIRKMAAVEIEDYEDAIICRDSQKELKKEEVNLKM